MPLGRYPFHSVHSTPYSFVYRFLKSPLYFVPFDWVGPEPAEHLEKGYVHGRLIVDLVHDYVVLTKEYPHISIRPSLSLYAPARTFQ